MNMEFKTWTIVTYLGCASFLLWFLSLGSQSGFSVEEFISFTTVVYGGGLAVYGLEKMIRKKYDPSNNQKWVALFVTLFVLLLAYIFILIAINIALIDARQNFWFVFFAVVVLFVSSVVVILKIDDSLIRKT